MAKEGRPKFNPRPGRGKNPGPSDWQPENLTTAQTSHTHSSVSFLMGKPVSIHDFELPVHLYFPKATRIQTKFQSHLHTGNYHLHFFLKDFNVFISHFKETSLYII